MDIIKLLTVKEAARRLGLCTDTVYAYVKDGTIKAVRYHARGEIRIKEEEIERLLSTDLDNDLDAK